MYNKRLILLISVICGVNTQFDLGDVCETRDGRPGICKYEQTCKDAIELKTQERHPTECSYDGRTLIACCPEDYTTGIISRFFVGTEGVIANANLTCHYDGYLPMMCCPTAKDIQPPEPAGCPPLPRVRTPTFDKPGYKSAWEQCVANERYVNVCEQTGSGYRRSYNCSVPIDAMRISGGEPAPPMEFAHMAILGCDSGISTENKIAWVGGGSLISSKFILTAGHVLITPIGKVRYAFLGSLDKTNIREGQLFGVTQLIPHNEYTPAEKKHDIALVKLNSPVTFSKFIRPACLPLPGINPENDVRLIAGWGETIYKQRSTNLLQKAVINIVPGAECKKALSFPDFVWNDKTMICARGMKSLFGITDSCQGDSGGPLMYKVMNKDFDCNYVVDGVVSWGGKCGNGVPAAYTRVSAYLDWIVDTVWPQEHVEDAFSDRANTRPGVLEDGFGYRSLE